MTYGTLIHPDRPSIEVVSDGPARHEVLQTLVAAPNPIRAAAIGHNRITSALHNPDNPPDTTKLLASHEVQHGIYEVTVLAFWRTDEVPS